MSENYLDYVTWKSVQKDLENSTHENIEKRIDPHRREIKNRVNRDT